MLGWLALGLIVLGVFLILVIGAGAVELLFNRLFDTD